MNIKEIRTYCVENNISLIINCNLNVNDKSISANKDCNLYITDTNMELKENKIILG